MNYFEKNKGYVTPSWLKMFMQCPRAFYLAAYLGLETPRKNIFEGGNAFDFYLSNGHYQGTRIRNFFQEFHILPPRKKRSKERVNDKGQKELTHSVGSSVFNASMNAEKKWNKKGLIDESEKQVSMTSEYDGIKIKGTADMVNDDYIFDFKFSHDVSQLDTRILMFGWDMQLAMYRFMYREMTGKNMKCCLLVADSSNGECVEKMFTEMEMDLREEEMKDYISEIKSLGTQEENFAYIPDTIYDKFVVEQRPDIVF